MPAKNPSNGFDAPNIYSLSCMLDGYEVECLIAVGGMGAVYKARQLSLDRTVAIKVLPRALGDDAVFRENFQEEAKMMAKLNHPNLLAIYDFGHKNGLLYIIMEYSKGKTLYHSAHGKAVESNTAAKLIQDVLEGIEHAHKVGLLHRDLKPANILLLPGTIPKVGDFGLARPMAKTETGQIYGSPGYVAPEVLADPEAVDERADIYALGVIFYELLTGRLPDQESYQPVSSIVNVDPRIDAVIERAIHLDMHQRYRRADEMRHAIAEVFREEGTKKQNLASTHQKPVTQLLTPDSYHHPSMASSASVVEGTQVQTSLLRPSLPSSKGRAKPANSWWLGVAVIIVMLCVCFSLYVLKRVL